MQFIKNPKLKNLSFRGIQLGRIRNHSSNLMVRIQGRHVMVDLIASVTCHINKRRLITGSPLTWFNPFASNFSSCWCLVSSYANNLTTTHSSKLQNLCFNSRITSYSSVFFARSSYLYNNRCVGGNTQLHFPTIFVFSCNFYT